MDEKSHRIVAKAKKETLMRLGNDCPKEKDGLAADF